MAGMGDGGLGPTGVVVLCVRGERTCPLWLFSGSLSLSGGGRCGEVLARNCRFWSCSRCCLTRLLGGVDTVRGECVRAGAGAGGWCQLATTALLGGSRKSRSRSRSRSGAGATGSESGELVSSCISAAVRRGTASWLGRFVMEPEAVPRRGFVGVAPSSSSRGNCVRPRVSSSDADGSSVDGAGDGYRYPLDTGRATSAVGAMAAFCGVVGLRLMWQSGDAQRYGATY